MIEGSTLGFNAIRELPTDLERRHVHGNDETRVASGGCGVPVAAAKQEPCKTCKKGTSLALRFPTASLKFVRR
jgi:hypothetical protein